MFDTTTTTSNASSRVGTDPPATVIDFSHVSKRFSPEVLGLDDVSFGVPPSQVVVLLGLSGSGKSTLLRHVNGLQRPTGGDIKVLGWDLGLLKEGGFRNLRRRVGFVFQEFNLVRSITVLENVCTGLLGSLHGPRMGLWMYSRHARRQALEQLDRVGLADRAFQRTDTLSGGQQQRVAIARALIQQPSVLLADEPVASLDPESSAQVLDLITRISREDHLTVLCSLHQVELALNFADRVIGLRHGRIVLDQPADRISHSQAMAIYGRNDLPSRRPAGEPVPDALVG
jgi:phosphonate transport system ATP-binding protein